MHDIAPFGSVASAKSDAEAQAGCDKHGRGMHQLFKVRKSHNIEIYGPIEWAQYERFADCTCNEYQSNSS